MSDEQKNKEDPNKRYCYLCKRKEPPVLTELIPGENTYQQWIDKSHYACFDCARKQGADTRENRKSIFNQYRQRIHDETVQKFEEQWNDLAGIKDIIKRIYLCWHNNKRRDKALGIQTDWICEVIFKNWWFLKASTVLDDYFEETQMNQSKRNSREQILLDFVVHNLEEWQGVYRKKARDRLKSYFATLNRRYHRKELMVAKPVFVDPTTKDSMKNWYLLSKQEDKNERDIIKLRIIEAAKHRMDVEQEIVRRNEQTVFVKEGVEDDKQV